MAETVRIATFAAPLSRRGPGLLLRDILKSEEQVLQAVETIRAVDPDIIVLTDFDFDHGGAALTAFAMMLDYPNVFAKPPNTGVPTGLDVDRNGYFGDARDAQGYGRFEGDGGMAILSKLPIGEVVSFDHTLWRDAPNSRSTDPPELAEIQWLSTTGHWIVPIAVGETALNILAFSATPPVFDGPENRNDRRNADEVLFWLEHLGIPHPIIAGNANLDPNGGEGNRTAIAQLLADPRLQDPLPDQTTADWPDGPGALRVSYVLPSADLTVRTAGIERSDSGPHALVWVDVVVP
ncbi:endonuclease/exonuclease/phosphatase family protein [Marivivens donghaensis]|uniref:endonuclease/exonuclease/phosphatase family protein n=1 Tax=Marivivens donghaensis TaxID=1699413 RepID=UPI001FEBC839|nr:endonuclease/exonuclease/phosphatase family protein [Marivivens donghaensis]